MRGPANDVSLNQNDFGAQSSSRRGCSMPRRTTANNDKLFFDVHTAETIGTAIQGVVVIVVDVVEVVVEVEEVVLEVVVDAGTVVVVDVVVLEVVEVEVVVEVLEVVVDSGTIVDVVVDSGTVVEVVVLVDVVEVVVVTATNSGSCNGCTGTGFGQYREGYPN